MWWYLGLNDQSHLLWDWIGGPHRAQFCPELQRRKCSKSMMLVLLMYVGISPSLRCEAFSTYPRTYDLIHASGVFSMYQDRYGWIFNVLFEKEIRYRVISAFQNRFKDVFECILWSSTVVEHYCLPSNQKLNIKAEAENTWLDSTEVYAPELFSSFSPSILNLIKGSPLSGPLFWCPSCA